MNTPHTIERTRRGPSPRRAALAFLLVLLPLAVYVPAYDAGFYSDDISHIVRNERLRTTEGLREIWTDVRGTDDLYYPMTFTTYWVDHHLWGSNPSGYHIVNIVLHALNSLLVWLVVRRLGIPAAWFAGAIFALHPVHVESVAWVTERRNTLSAFFYLLSMLAYLAYRPIVPSRRRGRHEDARLPSETPDVHATESRHRVMFAVALALFAAALLSKTATLTLPAAILLLTWWKRGRLTRRDWVPLIPFFLLGIGLSLWTARLEKALIEQGGPGWGVYTPADRLIIAGKAVWFYLGKLVYPARLSFVYPRWGIAGREAAAYLYPIAVVVTAGVLITARRRIGRGPATGFLFLVGTLLPVLGLVDYFYMMLSFVADRFLYLPSLGIIVLVAGCAGAALRRVSPGGRRLAIAIGAALLAVLATSTWRRSATFENAETLYRDVIAKHPDSWVGHYSLGTVLAASQRPAEARPQLEEALRLNANFPSIRGYLGVVYSQLGRLEDALRLLREGLAQNPNDVEIRTNLAITLATAGRYDEAIDECASALAINPRYEPAKRNLSRIALHGVDSLLAAGDTARAAGFARKVRSVAESVGAGELVNEIEQRLQETPAPPE